ncbi:MAG: hypothetical protein IJD95_02170 [Clostridia bacterium]|nr:hypothetical protein [Clostridia bacterium]
MKLKLLYLPISKIITDDALFDGDGAEHFSASVKRYGLIRPVTVFKCGKGYRLLCGERELYAAEQAGLKFVPCAVIKGNPTELYAAECCRRLSVSSHFFDRCELISDFINEFSLSKGEAASLLALPEREISRALLLLKIPAAARLMLKENGATEEQALLYLRKSFLLSEECQAAKRDMHIKMAFDDYRIFKNTIEKTVKKINEAGIAAFSDYKEMEKGLTCTIELKKENVPSK